VASGIIGEAILIIASVVIATSVAAVVMNQVGVFQSTFTATTEGQKEQLLTKVKIIMATNTTDSHVAVWVKNTGVNPIGFVDKVDVYFGQINQIQRIPYDDNVAQPNLTWQYWNATAPDIPTPVWQKMDTFALNVTDNSLQKGVTYHVTVSTPNGVTDEHIFSLPS
jgi:archaeal flagellar protein FlaG